MSRNIEKIGTIVILVFISIYSWKIGAALFLVLLLHAIFVQTNLLEDRLIRKTIQDFNAIKAAFPEKSEDDICRILIGGRLKAVRYKKVSIEEIRRDIVDPQFPEQVDLAVALKRITESENPAKYGDLVAPKLHDRMDLQTQRRIKLAERIEKFVSENQEKGQI